MRSPIFPFILATCMAVPFAQGSSAVITLASPPPGGEGYSALQTGAALSQGAASLYHNPALMAGLERASGSQLHYTRSEQDLLPILGLADLHQEFWSAAVVFPDPENGTDMAVGIFRNRINFGPSERTDAQGSVIGSGNTDETVTGIGTAIRLGLPISMGATVKFYDSRLVPGDDGKAGRGWAFDLGLVANPRLSPDTGLGLPAFAVTPSLGMVVRNLGPDAFYAEALKADPIPTTYTVAYGLKVEAMDLAGFQAGADMDNEWTARSDRLDQVRVLGYSWDFLGFGFGEGWLDDPSGIRFENHSFRSLEISLLRIHRILGRLNAGDFSSPSEAFDKGFLFGKTRIAGMPFRANPRLVAGYREIHSRDNGIRDGQHAYFFGISL